MGSERITVPLCLRFALSRTMRAIAVVPTVPSQAPRPNCLAPCTRASRSEDATQRHPRLSRDAAAHGQLGAAARPSFKRSRNAVPGQRAGRLPAAHRVATAAGAARLGHAIRVRVGLAPTRARARLRRRHTAGLLGRRPGPKLERRRQRRFPRRKRSHLHAPARRGRFLLPVVWQVRRRLLVDDLPRLGRSGRGAAR